jgi:hypothetical protein
MVVLATAFMAAAATGQCASLRGAAGPAAQAPQPRVGDRWVYRATDGYRNEIAWQETYEVTSVAPDAINVKVNVKGAGVDHTRTEIWSGPGVMTQGAILEAETRRFEPGWIRYRYPMATGDSWSQSIRNPETQPGPYGPMQSKVTVGGYEKVTTPAGTYNAIKLRYFLRMDDETFWHLPTEADYYVWYAPELGVLVREEKRSRTIQKGHNAGSANFGTRAIYQLVSFTRG